jgi:hypothetical protein
MSKRVLVGFSVCLVFMMPAFYFFELNAGSYYRCVFHLLLFWRVVFNVCPVSGVVVGFVGQSVCSLSSLG